MLWTRESRLALAGLILFALGGLTLAGSRVTRGQTQAGMNQTASKDYTQADGEMRSAYKKLTSVLNNEQKSELEKSQSLWLKFRDAEGAFLSSKAKGGSVYPSVYAENVKAITQERTQGLKKAYKRFTTEGKM
jgi:uncharacterized protein YecT (DUF1311 family)